MKNIFSILMCIIIAFYSVGCYDNSPKADEVNTFQAFDDVTGELVVEVYSKKPLDEKHVNKCISELLISQQEIQCLLPTNETFPSKVSIEDNDGEIMISIEVYKKTDQELLNLTLSRLGKPDEEW